MCKTKPGQEKLPKIFQRQRSCGAVCKEGRAEPEVPSIREGRSGGKIAGNVPGGDKAEQGHEMCGAEKAAESTDVPGAK